MDLFELDNAKNCIYRIEDSLKIIKKQLNTGNPDKIFCIEKLTNASSDFIHLLSLLEKEDKKNE